MEPIVAFCSVTKVPKKCMRGDELDLTEIGESREV